MDGIIQNAADVIVLVLLFSLTIFVHELGHFLVAKRLGMVIEVFSLGFGPAIWKRKINGVVYKIGWIPVGGYVALPQLDPSGMATIQGSGEKDGDGKDVGAQAQQQKPIPPIPPSYKILVSLAGAVGNMIFALILATVIYLSPSAITDEGNTIVGVVARDSAAFAAGLREGDRILAVNGREVRIWHDFKVECHLACGRTNEVKILAETANGKRTFVISAERDFLDIQTVRGVDAASLPHIHTVVKGSPADRAGLKRNDVIKRVGGVDIRWSHEYLRVVESNVDRDLPVTLERDGKLMNVTLHPSSKQDHNWPFKSRSRDRMIDDGTLQVYDGPWENLCLVSSVGVGSPADKGGIMPGDILRSIAGVRISSAEVLNQTVAASLNKSVAVVVERESGLTNLFVTPLLSKQHKRAVLGITHAANPYIDTVSDYESFTGVGIGYELPPWMQFRNPFRQIVGDIRMVLRVLEALMTPTESSEAVKGLGGPVSIVLALWLSIKISLLNGAGFLRFLNVNLAILNLLPLPVLDGGHIVFASLEGLTRRKLNPKFVNVLVNTFAMLLIALFIFLLFRDTRFVQKFFFTKKNRPIEYVPAPAVTNQPGPDAAVTTNNTAHEKPTP